MQIAAGFSNPHIDQMPKLSQVLKGIKVHAARTGHRSRPRLPITPAVLRKLRDVWFANPSCFDNLMLWAAATTTFFSFCRSGEVTVELESNYDPNIHLSFGDLAVDQLPNPSSISLQLKRSKTDQLMKGVKLVLGRTHDELCPVSALLSYLARRGAAPGPLFLWENRRPLSKSKFVYHIRQALLSAGPPAHLYVGHSFRIGAATMSASAGVLTPLSRRWDDGTVHLISCTSNSTQHTWQMSLPLWPGVQFD